MVADGTPISAVRSRLVQASSLSWSAASTARSRPRRHGALVEHQHASATTAVPVNTDAAGRARSANGHDTANSTASTASCWRVAPGWAGRAGRSVAATVPSSPWDRAWTVDGESTPRWLLYGVIAISPAVIIGGAAVAQARREALEDSPSPAPRPARSGSGRPAAAGWGRRACTRTAGAPRRTGATARATRHGRPSARRRARDDGGGPALVRCAVVIAIAMGVAVLAIAFTIT